MKDQSQTEMQLINELAELRKRIAELKTLENERKQTEEALLREPMEPSTERASGFSTGCVVVTM
jgi:hypothetical protein